MRKLCRSIYRCRLRFLCCRLPVGHTCTDSCRHCSLTTFGFRLQAFLPTINSFGCWCSRPCGLHRLACLHLFFLVPLLFSTCFRVSADTWCGSAYCPVINCRSSLLCSTLLCTTTSIASFHHIFNLCNVVFHRRSRSLASFLCWFVFFFTTGYQTFNAPLCITLGQLAPLSEQLQLQLQLSSFFFDLVLFIKQLNLGEMTVAPTTFLIMFKKNVHRFACTLRKSIAPRTPRTNEILYGYRILNVFVSQQTATSTPSFASPTPPPAAAAWYNHVTTLVYIEKALPLTSLLLVHFACLSLFLPRPFTRTPLLFLI